MSSIVDDNACMFSWAGNNKRLLVYPVDHDKYFNMTCTHGESLSDGQTSRDGSAAAIAYNQKVPLNQVLSVCEDFEPRAKRLFELADPEGFRVWKLQDMDNIPLWSKVHTVLIGDACHPLSSFGFSRASMGIEDALTLSTLLPADTEVGKIPERLRLYEEIRKPRVARVRETGRSIAQGSDEKETVVKYMQFLASYNAVAFAEEALSKLLKAGR